MEGIYNNVIRDSMDDDEVSMKSAKDDDFLNLSRYTVYHSAQDLDNPKTALFQNHNHEPAFHKVGPLLNLFMSQLSFEL